MYDVYDYNIFGLDYGSLDVGYVGCPQMMLYINDQQNNSYVDYGSIVTFKICGAPNADFIIQDVGIYSADNTNIGVGYVNDFYPYNVIERGQLDSNGIYIFSTPLNKVGTFVFRAGIWCTIADINYCTQVSNTVTISVLEKGCTASYVCKQPLDGYEYDENDCGGADRLNSKCDPLVDGSNDNNVYNLVKVGVVVAIVGIAVNYYINKKES